MRRGPKVGIFWVLPRGKLLVYAFPWQEALSSPEGSQVLCWVNFAGHAEYWEKHPQVTGWPETEYTDHPRGRVIFDPAGKKAKILLNRRLARNKKLVGKIARAFRLTAYSLVLDQHYEDFLPLEEKESGGEK